MFPLYDLSVSHAHSLSFFISLRSVILSFAVLPLPRKQVTIWSERFLVNK